MSAGSGPGGQRSGWLTGRDIVPSRPDGMGFSVVGAGTGRRLNAHRYSRPNARGATRPQQQQRQQQQQQQRQEDHATSGVRGQGQFDFHSSYPVKMPFSRSSRTVDRSSSSASASSSRREGSSSAPPPESPSPGAAGGGGHVDSDAHEFDMVPAVASSDPFAGSGTDLSVVRVGAGYSMSADVASQSVTGRLTPHLPPRPKSRGAGAAAGGQGGGVGGSAFGSAGGRSRQFEGRAAAEEDEASLLIRDLLSGAVAGEALDHRLRHLSSTGKHELTMMLGNVVGSVHAVLDAVPSIVMSTEGRGSNMAEAVQQVVTKACALLNAETASFFPWDGERNAFVGAIGCSAHEGDQGDEGVTQGGHGMHDGGTRTARTCTMRSSPETPENHSMVGGNNNGNSNGNSNGNNNIGDDNNRGSSSSASRQQAVQPLNALASNRVNHSSLEIAARSNCTVKVDTDSHGVSEHEKGDRETERPRDRNRETEKQRNRKTEKQRSYSSCTNT